MWAAQVLRISNQQVGLNRAEASRKGRVGVGILGAAHLTPVYTRLCLPRASVPRSAACPPRSWGSGYTAVAEQWLAEWGTGQAGNCSLSRRPWAGLRGMEHTSFCEIPLNMTSFVPLSWTVSSSFLLISGGLTVFCALQPLCNRLPPCSLLAAF